MNSDLKADTNFLFEVGQLGRLPRSGHHYIHGFEQSIADHSHRTAFIGLLLANQGQGIDKNKVIRMCLFHDLGETRTGDLNHLNQQYVKADEHKAVNDTLEGTAVKTMVLEDINEYEQRESREALLAKEADILELLLTFKEIIDNGNPTALTWIAVNEKRLKTAYAKQLAESIKSTRFDEWWLGNKHADWVSKNK